MAKKIYNTDYLNNAMESRYYFSDRDVSSPTTLPYTFYDIKIKPNDLVTVHAINGALGKLYDNLLHIISQSRVPQAVIPRKKEFSTIITTSQTTANTMSAISAYDSNQVSAMKSTTRNNELASAVCGFASNQEGLTKSSHVVFTQSKEASDEIGMTIFYDDDTSGVEFKSYTTDLDNFTNRKLRGVNKMINHENTGYILDTNSSVVYKYDITGLMTDDASYFDPSQRSKGKLLTDFVGGTGDIDDNMRFNNPVTICTDTDGNLYIVDMSLSKTIVKVFDKNTNFLEKHDITSHLYDETPVDIQFIRGRMFLLTTKNILEFSKKFIILNRWSQSFHVLSQNETYKQILPSKEDINTMYVVTNKNILKKFVSKPDRIISVFKYDNRKFGSTSGDAITNNNIDIAYASIVESVEGEYVYVCDKNTGQIYKFNESMSYQHCIDGSFENAFIKLHDLEIKPDEFVNHLVYNKSLSKLIFNHYLIGNNITSKLTCEWVDHYQKRYVGTRYALPERVYSRGLTPKLNNFIGVNEPVMSAVINRTLKEIYLLQLEILKDIEIETINPRSEDVTSIISINAPGSTWEETSEGSGVWELK